MNTHVPACAERDPRLDRKAREIEAKASQRAELAMRESEARFQLMADTAPVMIWMSGPDKLCTYFNKNWLAFTGRSHEREVGNGWSEGVHPDDLQRCLGTYVRAFDARREFRMEYRLQRFDGEYRWMLDTGVPRFESDGAFDGYIGSCIDITDHKEVEELRERLVRVSRVTTMGELAASIAHEVNQPLCAIVSNAQTVERVLGAEAFDIALVREAVQDITRDGQRASVVIARIRDFLQKVPAEYAPVTVNDVIREVSALMRSDMARRGIAVQLELEDNLPSVLGRKVHLQQVIVNLMANGADAMDPVARELRKLTIISTQDGTGAIVVTVQDAGVGTDLETIAHIFDPFFTTKPGGMGMGLAICKSIVAAHGGEIFATPNADRGTSFRFTLPPLREGAR